MRHGARDRPRHSARVIFCRVHAGSVFACGESMFPVRSIADALWSFWSRGEPVERRGYLVGALLLSSGLIHLAMLVSTGASWEGPLSLRKPATFGLSFGLTLITLTWVTSFLRLSHRARVVQLGLFTVACVV